MSPLGLLFVAATVWMVFMLSRKQSGRSGGFFLLTTLGVVSMLAGLFVFASRDVESVSARSDKTSSVVDVPDIDIEPPDIDINFDPGFPFRSIRPDIKIRPPIVDVNFERGFSVRASESEPGRPTWMTISLGAMLLIVGSLLVTRGRTRPLALKALTLLGAGAVVYSLVSFFGSTPRIVVPRDRIVRVDSRTELAPPVEQKVQKPKRPSRAKRPASRPERPSSAESPSETLPPRAGSIPVEAELAKSAAPTAPPAAVTPDQPAVALEAASPAPAAPVQPTVPSPEAAASSPAAAVVPAAAPEENRPDKPAAPPEETKPAVAAEAKDAPAATPAATNSPAVAPVANEKPAEAPAGNVAPAAPLPQPPAAPATPAIAIAPAATTVAPAIAPEVSQGRPPWVDAPAKLNNSVYSITVNSGLFVTVPECQRQLDVQIKHEADQYIDEYVGERASHLVDIPLSYLRDHVKKAEYAELVRSESVGPMHQIHALLEFDDQARSDFRRMWHNAVVTDRLWYAGSGAALVLALLGTFYGYLKLDLRTSGAQKGRLQLAATLVALIIAAGALLARWAVPF